MLAAAANWVGIADVVVGCVLTVLIALVGYIFQQLRKQVDQNSRHVQDVMYSLWRLLWRIDAAEDHLAERHHYNPPRTMPEWPFKPDP